ncbi:MAG: dTMP kinase [Candidatus Thorarchaeota archaeon]|nr:MAG: dTMP kinase [Candidatus Thorarchaeota archaeon]
MSHESAERNGWLFVLEGVDGAGKTAVCNRVVEMLTQDGHQVTRIREPTDESKWGKEIRARSPKGELTPSEELELFIRDREWNVANRILPALAAGKVVLMDRYFFATGAYQTVSTGLPWQEILERNREEIGAPEPDIIFILDLPAEVGLERALGREGDRNEQFEQIERLISVRLAYLEMSKQDHGTYIVVDATQSLETVVLEVFSAIKQVIE